MIESLLQWAAAHALVLRWLSIVSLFTFTGTLLLVPTLAARIPDDYFSQPERHRIPWAQHHPLWRAVLVTMKNLLGATVFLFGMALLALPGQGLLTMAIGITLLDFPGKYRVERWLVGRGPLLHAINVLRRRSGRAPLKL